MPADEQFSVPFGLHLSRGRRKEKTDSGARTDDICTARQNSRAGFVGQAKYPSHRSRSRCLFGQGPKIESKPPSTGGERETSSCNCAEFTASVKGRGGAFFGGGDRKYTTGNQTSLWGFLCWFSTNCCKPYKAEAPQLRTSPYQTNDRSKYFEAEFSLPGSERCCFVTLHFPLFVPSDENPGDVVADPGPRKRVARIMGIFQGTAPFGLVPRRIPELTAAPEWPSISPLLG